MNQQKHQHNQPHKDQKDKLNNFARFSGIAFQMFAIIAVGTIIGYKLDEKYPNKHQIYTSILSVSFVVISIIYVIRRIIANSKEDK